jgi:aspartyl-tRNA synthetase
MERTAIGQLPKKIGDTVKLTGWVHSRRDHGQIIFIDLRDRSGLVQVVFLNKSKELYAVANKLRSEFVAEVVGKVNERPKGMQNPNLPTGTIEVLAEKLNIINEAETLPFDIDRDGYEVKEDLRLKYRYLDLRRARMLRNLQVLHRAKNFIRNYLTDLGFIEVDTPILSKSTPEGARDMLVPSRQYPGKFYALPQSPQQYKQLLMVAGVEKYFQIPRCFRDEDLRSDRLLEFDQLDIEMSFVDQEDILQLTEKMMIELTEKVFNKKIQDKPFPRISFETAMQKYKSDRPDLRKDKKNPDIMSYVWVLDFPMFEKKDDGSLGAIHHPFTALQDTDVALLDDADKITQIKAKQYDLVLNGNEIFGGSIRTHNPKTLARVFEVLGHTPDEIEQKFGHLLEAFKYGVPPHGGIAAGFGRVLMVALNEKSIREVVPFPTTGKGTTSVMDAPSEVAAEQLRELGLKIK